MNPWLGHPGFDEFQISVTIKVFKLHNFSRFNCETYVQSIMPTFIQSLILNIIEIVSRFQTLGSFEKIQGWTSWIPRLAQG